MLYFKDCKNQIILILIFYEEYNFFKMFILSINKYFNMDWTINVKQGDTIIYDNELNTIYDNIILSYELDRNVIKKCCIFKLPNTILYHYNSTDLS
jgi:hypothetical protein